MPRACEPARLAPCRRQCLRGSPVTWRAQLLQRRPAAGSTSAGRRSRQSSSTLATTCSDRRAGRPRHRERPPTSPSSWSEAITEAAAARRIPAERVAGHRGRLAWGGQPRDRRGHECAQPPRLGGNVRARVGAQQRAGHARDRRQRRAGRHRRRVQARCRKALPVAARRVLGNRRRRRADPRRQAVGRAWWSRRDRACGRRDRRGPVRLRATRVHGGICGAWCDGGARSAA